MNRLNRTEGQFIPISAMVMFTMVVLMIAMKNVYEVSRAKLQVQNLADAAALNLAGQQAQAMNNVGSRNEWLNHMMAGVPSPSDSTAPGIADCTAFNAANKSLLPGISCLENPYAGNSKKVQSRHIFNTKEGAANYAAIVQTVNQAQMLFVDAYNNFLGDKSKAASGGNASGPAHFASLLKTDIPALGDGSVSLVAWNSANGERDLEDAKDMPGGLQAHMEGMRFKPHHDIQTAYYKKKCIGPFCVKDAHVEKTSLGDLMFGKGGGGANPVGWLVPDWNKTPKIAIKTATGTSNQLGVGVLVKKDVMLPVIGNVPVAAKAKAYVVSNSGNSGDSSDIPKFKPTYWSKLAN